MSRTSQRINVISRTQRVEVSAPNVVAITNAGPVGPPGVDGDAGVNGGMSEPEVDAKIVEHNTATTAHPNITSGRDFAAVFQNGLV